MVLFGHLIVSDFDLLLFGRGLDRKDRVIVGLLFLKMKHDVSPLKAYVRGHNPHSLLVF